MGDKTNFVRLSNYLEFSKLFGQADEIGDHKEQLISVTQSMHPVSAFIMDEPNRPDSVTITCDGKTTVTNGAKAVATAQNAVRKAMGTTKFSLGNTARGIRNAFSDSADITTLRFPVDGEKSVLDKLCESPEIQQLRAQATPVVQEPAPTVAKPAAKPERYGILFR